MDGNHFFSTSVARSLTFIISFAHASCARDGTASGLPFAASKAASAWRRTYTLIKQYNTSPSMLASLCAMTVIAA